ncbi:hypothetical protein [Streptomyces sp. NPDC050355]|uniref:Uncharacterized protein n=1 Tax=Streptomyces sirii TaxID=3127701 RepID=A0ABZ2QFU2_9ACTN
MSTDTTTVPPASPVAGFAFECTPASTLTNDEIRAADGKGGS